MKKKNTIITLASAMAFLCVGGAFALNANTSVSADTTKKQIMLGASVLLTDGEAGKDANGIRFPVVVEDSVAEAITKSTTYVLPANYWTKSEAPTAEEVKESGDPFETTGKWVNYYELNEGYGDAYSEAVVYIYNLPDTKYATEFYVCSEIVLNDNTSELSDVVCRSMSGVSASAINSGEYKVAELENYLEEVDYQVNNYLRTVYGNYEKTGETSTVTGYAGLNVNYATGDEVEGYTYNANLTKLGNENFVIEEGATLNAYYENDKYTFETQSLNAVHSTTIVKEEMTGVPVTDLQPNTYKITRTHLGDYSHDFKYTADNVGKYLVLNVYYTATNEMKVSVWDAPFTKTVPVVTVYDGEGNLQYSNENKFYLNKWVNVVVYLDEQFFPKTLSNFRFTLADWAGATTVYFGEYTYLTEEEYKANFEQVPIDTNVPTGVTAYKGTSLKVAPNATSKLASGINGIARTNPVASGNAYMHTMMISDVTSYKAGQYVVARIKGATAGSAMALYGPNQESNSEAMICAEDGTVVNAGEANTWYYYMWKVSADCTVAMYKLSFRITLDNAATYISDLYVIDNDTALQAFLQYKLPNYVGSRYTTLPTEGVTTYTSSDLVNVDSNVKAFTATGFFNGKYVSHSTSVGWWNRRLKLNSELGVTYTAGKYFAIEVMFASTTGNGYINMWDATNVGIYEKATGEKVDKPEVNKTYLYVYELGTGSNVGTFGLYEAWAKGLTGYIGHIYIFDNATVFNNWMNA